MPTDHMTPITALAKRLYDIADKLDQVEAEDVRSAALACDVVWRRRQHDRGFRTLRQSATECGVSMTALCKIIKSDRPDTEPDIICKRPSNAK